VGAEKVLREQEKRRKGCAKIIRTSKTSEA